MKLLSVVAAASLAVAPAQAEVYSHSFPGVGPTGTYCTTVINGGAGSTSCSRGLTNAEQAADKAQWQQKTTRAAKAQGLPGNYCQQLIAKAKGSDGDLILCQGAVQRGEQWNPYGLLITLP